MCAVQATRGTSLSSPRAAEATLLRRERWLLVGVAVGGYLLDRATKIWAVRNLDPADPPSYLGGLLKLRLIFNPGAAFSFGSSFTIVLGLLAIAALVVLLVGVVPKVRGWWPSLACGLLLAGIAGNLTDRLIRPPGVLRGEVVDFIALPNFAIFNVADICLTAAALIIVILALFGKETVAAGPTGGEPVAVHEAETVQHQHSATDPGQGDGRDPGRQG